MAREVISVWGPQKGEDGEVARKLHDMGRLAAGVWAVYLEVTPGGLTLARLTSLMIQTRVSGPGRARTLIAYLRFIRFIEPAPIGEDARRRLFVTTPALKTAFRHRVRNELRVRRHLDPAVEWVLDRIDDDDIFGAYFTLISEVSMTLMEIGTKRESTLNLFSERYAGMTALGEILLGGDLEDTFPPRGPVRYSLADVANRCGTSRAQVMGLVKRARQEGLLVPHEDGGEVLGDRLRDDVEAFIAGTTGMVVGVARIVAGNRNPASLSMP